VGRVSFCPDSRGGFSSPISDRLASTTRKRVDSSSKNVLDETGTRRVSPGFGKRDGYKVREPWSAWSERTRTFSISVMKTHAVANLFDLE
jgi:hypothetical protein